MKERTYCTGEYTGFGHRTHQCRVCEFCEKYNAFKEYLEAHNYKYPNFDDTYNEFHICDNEVSNRAEKSARNSLSWLGATSM